MPTAAPLPELTAAQFAVCQLAANGDDNDTIATTLRLTKLTVKVHLRAAFKRLGISKRTELLNYIKPQLIAETMNVEMGDWIDEQIMEGVGAGKTDPDIAMEIKVTLSLVQARIKRLVKRVNVRNRTDLAAWYRNLKGTLADREVGMTERSVNVIERLYREGKSVDDIARDLNISADVVTAEIQPYLAKKEKAAKLRAAEASALAEAAAAAKSAVKKKLASAAKAKATRSKAVKLKKARVAA